MRHERRSIRWLLGGCLFRPARPMGLEVEAVTNFLRQGWLSPLFARVADAPPVATPAPGSVSSATTEPGDSPTDLELEAAHVFLRAPRPVDAREAMIALDKACGGSIHRMDAAIARASVEYRANLLLDRILGRPS